MQWNQQTISSVLSTKEENGNPLQCSCLGYSMDRGAWQATVPGITRVRQDWVTKPPHNLLVNLWSRNDVEFRLHMAHLKWSNVKDQYGSRHFYLKVIWPFYCFCYCELRFLALSSTSTYFRMKELFWWMKNRDRS